MVEKVFTTFSNIIAECRRRVYKRKKGVELQPDREERRGTYERHKINSLYNLEDGDYFLETEEYGKKRKTEFIVLKGVFYWGRQGEKSMKRRGY